MADNTTSRRRATTLVRGGTQRSGFCETSEAIFMTSGYVYESAAEAEAAFTGEKKRFVYSRFANPSVGMFEARMAALDGAEFCMATASGMAAVNAALLASVRAGSRVVASNALFGSCHFIVAQLLPRYGVETVLVDGTDLDQWKDALATKTDAIFLETPSNPTLKIIDVPAVCEMGRAAGARVVVDNVFATPVLQRPLDMGADVTIYSATKHLDGQGRSLGGAILTNDGEWMENELVPFLRNTGPALSPFNAWVLLKGIETLELRMERHCQNALAAAHFLEARDGVDRVLYPGLESHPQHALAMKQMTAGGGVVAFELAGGGREAAFRFLDSLKLVDISNNLGDAKSLATHPSTTTHQRLTEDERLAMGIDQNMVRVSVGLEHIDDIKEDLDQALKAATG